MCVPENISYQNTWVVKIPSLPPGKFPGGHLTPDLPVPVALDTDYRLLNIMSLNTSHHWLPQPSQCTLS